LRLTKKIFREIVSFDIQQLPKQQFYMFFATFFHFYVTFINVFCNIFIAINPPKIPKFAKT